MLTLPPSALMASEEATPLLRAMISLLSKETLATVMLPMTRKPPPATAASVPPVMWSLASGAVVPMPTRPMQADWASPTQTLSHALLQQNASIAHTRFSQPGSLHPGLAWAAKHVLS